MSDTKRIGERIAMLRKKCGMTGEKFAELLHVSPQAVSKWETGKNLPETILLPDISRLLDVSIDSILVPETYPPAYKIRPQKKIATYTGTGWPHSNAYPALFAAIALFFGQETRLNEKQEQINDDLIYHIQAALTSEAYGLQYSELFECDCLQRCLGIYGVTPRIIDCINLDEQQVKELVCTAISKDTPVVMNHTNVDGALFVFGYKESGKILCCCEFIDGADEKNCSYDFVKYRPLRNRHSHVQRLIILDKSTQKMDLHTAYSQSLQHGLRMMATPSEKMNFAELRGAGSDLYDAWIGYLEQANEENSEEFYMRFPIFPQLIILYENRGHLNEFLKACSKVIEDNYVLLQAQKKCEELEILALEAVQIGCKNEHSNPEVLIMTNNERRNHVINILQRCKNLEQEMIKLMQTKI